MATVTRVRLSIHIVTISLSLSVSYNPYINVENPVSSEPSLRWDKLTKAHEANYRNGLDGLLHQRCSCLQLCSVVCGCSSPLCKDNLQHEYDDILSILKEADSGLPRYKPGIQKDWWTPSLTELRKKSTDIHLLWVTEGRPGHGPTHAERIRVRTLYKRATRTAQRDFKQASRDKLHNAFIENDTNSFWKKSYMPKIKVTLRQW